MCAVEELVGKLRCSKSDSEMATIIATFPVCCDITGDNHQQNQTQRDPNLCVASIGQIILVNRTRIAVATGSSPPCEPVV